ncbi:MAG: hypothetical protein AAFO95_13625 [Cyanobacteria bacterium J06600_6]
MPQIKAEKKFFQIRTGKNCQSIRETTTKTPALKGFRELQKNISGVK